MIVANVEQELESIEVEVQPDNVRKIRQQALSAQLHPESLLQVPLIKQAFCDLNFSLIQRAVDPHWTYEKLLPIAITGFNPFQGAAFYGHNSRFSEWLQNPFGSARSLNENDLLIREVLFMVHDYLHAWAYQVIDALHPEKRVLSGLITRETFDDYIFCHLVTEAVATVGLDYWSLSVRNVNSHCPIGSAVGTLTVSYHEVRLPEYRRFNPQLEVQLPGFFRDLATFYCTGEFHGFGIDDMRHSPQLLCWLEHELSYGATQRELTRSWFAFLSAERIDLRQEDLADPVPVDSPFRQAVLAELSGLLWEKVRGDTTNDLGILTEWKPASSDRQALVDKKPDFRFLNLGRTNREDWPRLSETPQDNFKYFLYQYLSAIPFAEVPEERFKHIDLLIQQRDLQLVLDLMGDLPRLEPYPYEPRDLFVAN